jgi:hypothetical protein
MLNALKEFGFGKALVNAIGNSGEIVRVAHCAVRGWVWAKPEALSHAEQASQ